MVECRIESYQRETKVPMRTTQQFSITLTHEMAEMVRAKVESGEYASESEVIRDGCARSRSASVLSTRGCVNRWLRPTTR